MGKKEKKRGKKNRAQTSIEFMLIIALVMFIFFGLSMFLANKYNQIKETNNDRAAESLIKLIKTEIDTARSSENGFSYYFDIPTTLNGMNYSITIENNHILIIDFAGKAYFQGLPDNIEGNIVLDDPSRKTYTTVYLKKYNNTLYIST